MTKLCFSCFKRIPLFAGKCPYCLDQYQGVYGRLILGLLLIVGLLVAAYVYTDLGPEAKVGGGQTIESVLKELKE